MPLGLARWLVRTEGLEPSLPLGKRIFVPLRLSPPKNWFVVWTIPSPCQIDRGSIWVRCRPSSLYTFADPVLPLQRLARDWHPQEAFPEFERFYAGRFHPGTQCQLSPLRLPIPPRPHAGFFGTADSWWRALDAVFCQGTDISQLEIEHCRQKVTFTGQVPFHLLAKLSTMRQIGAVPIKFFARICGMS